MRPAETIKGLLESSKSKYPDNCDGITTANTETYILGTVLAVGKDKIKFSNEGSQILDEINAFDIAETQGPYIGQLNMSTVSSFCGPQGLILGYDFLPSQQLFSKKNIFKRFVNDKGYIVEAYYIDPLIQSTKGILGTVDNPRYRIMPGAHVPFANKSFKSKGKCRLYSAVAIGISKDREKDACLLMEDCGILKTSETVVLNNLCESVLQVGRNQKVDYELIITGISSDTIEENEMGCALVAMPYIALASNLIDNHLDDLTKLTLEEWESKKYGD